VETTSWHGIRTSHDVEVAREMRSAIDAFDRLGAKAARDRCEERRVWLPSQFDEPWLAFWIDALARVNGDTTGETTRANLLKELEPAFAPFVRPQVVVVRFVTQPLADRPACPMWVWRDTRLLDVYAPAIGPHPTLGLSALDVTVRQLTFHELLHVHGDVAHDGVARHNWVGMGALVRATEDPPQPVNVSDGRRPEG
jgi:hypothetical protein